MPREKIKFALRIRPETQQLVKDLCPRDNCQSQNEFIEKAIHFYAGYISNRDSTEFLAPILVSTLDGTLKESETHICRMLFKLAVEMSMMMNVMAAGMEIGAGELEQLRGRCIQEVKKMHGCITFADAVKYQNGE